MPTIAQATTQNAPVVVTAGNLGASYTANSAVSTSLFVKGTLNANCTLGTPTGAAAGSSVTYELTQDATGGRAVTWFTALRPGGNLPQSSAASATDVFVAYTPDGTVWRVVAVGVGMA